MRFIIAAILFTCRFLEGTSTELTIFLSANEGMQMAQDLADISESQFYAISSDNKAQTAAVYNEDIADKILLINKYNRSFARGARNSANFVSNTLINLNVAVNQFIIDSSVNAPKRVIKADLAKIQSIIDGFSEGLASTLPRHGRKVSNALSEAESALQDFADQMETYVDELNQLVFHSACGNPKLVSSNYQLVLSLRKFVQFSSTTIFLGWRHE